MQIVGLALLFTTPTARSRALAVAAAFAAGWMALSWQRAAAQPQIPSTFFGTVVVDGRPPADGTEVRALIDGKDCTQTGPGFKGTGTDGGVSVYVATVMHESQEPGCGRDGKTITFTVGGRAAVQPGSWKVGAQNINLSVGQGPTVPLPTPTLTPTIGPTQAAASATSQALLTPIAATALPTDDPSILTSVSGPRGGTRATPPPAESAGGDSGGFPVTAALSVVIVALIGTGAAAGLAISRRKPRP
jgi:hypothetical protein